MISLLAAAVAALVGSHSAAAADIRFVELSAAGSTPKLRSGAGAAASDDTAFFLGGKVASGGKDFVAVDADGAASLPTTSGTAPVSEGPAYAASKDVVYAYGGMGSTGQSQRGTFKFDLGTKVWTKLAPTALTTPRRFAAAVVLRDCEAAGEECLVVHGGRGGTDVVHATTAVMQLPTTGAVKWEAPAAAQGGAPTGRYDHTLTADPTGRVAVMFGGRTGDDAKDATNHLWALSSVGFEDEGSLVNLALNRPVYAPKPRNGNANFHTSNLVDGLLNTVAGNGQCMVQSASAANSGASVDLGGPRTVKEVRFYPRTETAQRDSANGLRITVNNHRTDPLDGQGTPSFTECESPYNGRLPVPATIPCDGAVGRYVHAFLSGTGKRLDGCELMVMGPEPWKWKTLSTDEKELAQGKGVEATEQGYGGVATRINDGNTDQEWRGSSCIHSGTHTGTHHYIRIDLGASYDLTRIQLWDRSDGCCRSRSTDIELWVGDNPDKFDLNTECEGNVPSPLGNVDTIMCTKTGRYVWIVQPRVGHTLAICEAKVFGMPVRNLPSPRFGHAATQHRGMAWIYGGIGADGEALDDLHALDLLSYQFSSALRVIGSSPAGRAWASLAPAGNGALVLLGGRSGISSLTAAVEGSYVIQLPGCDDLTTTGVSTSNCFRGSCYYSCSNGYTVTNPVGGLPVTCEITGYYSGYVPVCQAQTAIAPTDVTATISGRTATITWTPVAEDDLGTYDEATHYAIRAAPSSFGGTDFGGGMTSLPGGWSFRARPSHTIAFEQGADKSGSKGYLKWVLGSRQDCWNDANDCSKIFIPWPKSIEQTGTGEKLHAGANWEVQMKAWVDSPQPIRGGVGITLQEGDARKQDYNRFRVDILFYRQDGNNYRVQASRSGSGLFAKNLGMGTNAQLQWLKMAYNVATNTISFFHKGRLDPDWLTLGSLKLADLNRGGDVSQGKLALHGKSWDTTTKTYFIDDIKVTTDGCANSGASRMAKLATLRPTGTPTGKLRAQVTQLTTDATYSFQAAAVTQAGRGQWSALSNKVRPSITPDLSRLINVARGKPTDYWGGVYDGLGSNRAVDGVHNNGGMGPNCYHSAQSYRPRMRIDLQQRYLVDTIRVYTRTGWPDRIRGAEVYVGDDASNWERNTKCRGFITSDRGIINDLKCDATGRYVLVVSEPRTTFLELCEVLVYSDIKCEDRAPPNTVQIGTCTGALQGDECKLSCLAGYTSISGETEATCINGQWSTEELECAAQCPAIPAPAGAESCTQAVAAEDFEDSSLAQKRFISADPDDFPLEDYWQVVDGRMISMPPPVDDTCLVEGQGVAVLLRDPDPRTLDVAHSVSIELSGERDAGLIFRAASGSVYFIASIGFASGVHKIVKRSGEVGSDAMLASSGVGIRKLDSSKPTERHELKVMLDGADIEVWLDGGRIMTARDPTLTSGDVGLWAEGPAEFDNLKLETPCLVGGGPTVSGCRDMYYQDTCAFKCRQGFTASGADVSSCKADGTLNQPDGAPGCGIRPPVAKNQAREVHENSARNTAVGEPVSASLEADEQMEFSIVAGDDGEAFKIGLCDGLIRVNDQTQLDYETKQYFNLTVKIGINGYSAFTEVNVTVTVLDVNEPPVLAAQTFTVEENCAVGTTVGVALSTLAEDPEDDTLTFSVEFDSTDGMVLLDETTGQLSLNFSAPARPSGSGHPVDYETSPASGGYLTIVRVEDIVGNTASSFITLRLNDTNDAPELAAGNAESGLPQAQVIVIDEVVALRDAQIGARMTPSVQAADQDSEEFLSDLMYRFTSKGAQGTDPLRGTVVRQRRSDGSPQTSANQVLQEGNVDLIAIDARQGNVSVIAVPSPDWSITSDYSPYLSLDAATQGMLVRAEYIVEVEVRDRYGAIDTQDVRFAIQANDSNIPIIREVACGTDAEGIQTAGGQSCVFTGTGLGSPGQVTPVEAWMTRVNPAGGEQRVDMTGCSVTVEATEITCTTSEGFGLGFDVHVNAQGQGALLTSRLQLSYKTPTVTEVSDSAMSLATEGGTQVVLKGENLGPTGVQTVFYSDGRGGQLPCRVDDTLLQAGETSHDTVRCVTSEGSGSDLQWMLSINGEDDLTIRSRSSGTDAASGGAGDASIMDVSTFTYAIPQITGLEGITSSLDITNLRTTGGEIVVVRGVNFGPATEPVRVKLSYSPDSPVSSMGLELAGYEYEMTQCTKPETGAMAHKLLHCTMPAGVGRGLVASAVVNGQSQVEDTCFAQQVDDGSLGIDELDRSVVCQNNTVAFVSFAPPVLTSVRGADGSDTRGGQSFTLVGTGFGPIELSNLGSVSSVIYGPAAAGNLRYDATATCRVSRADTEIECSTLPGTGRGLEFDVAIATQATVAAAVQTTHAYAQPVLASFEGEGAANALTPGGQVVVLKGNNFGPMPQTSGLQTPLNATYELSVAGAGMTVFQALDCVLVEAHVTIECKTAEGAGSALAWTVVVDSQPSRSPTTNYEVPEIIAIVRPGGVAGDRVDDADVDGGETFEIHGTGFGSPDLVLFDEDTGEESPGLQSITYGPTGTEYTPVSVNHVSHTLIEIETEPGWAENAYFRTTVAGQSSSGDPPATADATFDFATPEVISMDTVSTVDTHSPINSPQIVKLTTRNVPLRDRLSRPVVVFGGQVRQPTGMVLNQDGISQTISFTLPEHGGGFAIPVRVGLAPVSEDSSTSAPYDGSLSRLMDPGTIFSYAAPVIERLVVTRPAWTQPGYVVNADTSEEQNCSFSAGDPFSCDDNSVLQVLIIGTGFSDPRAFRQEGDARGVLRADVSMLPLLRYPLTVRSHTHNRILAYTDEQTGEVQVQVTARMPATLLDEDMTSALDVQADELVQRANSQTWQLLAPQIAALQGATTGLPTQGQKAEDGSPSEGNGITIRVGGLETSKQMRVLAGPSATSAVACRVWSLRDSIWLQDTATGADIQTHVIDVIDAAANQAGTTPVYDVSFLVPESPASPAPMDDIRIFVDRSGSLSSGDEMFAYAKPYVAAVDVWMPPSGSSGDQPTDASPVESHWQRHWVADDAKDVRVPTRGGWMRIRGQDLTRCPLVRLGDGSVATCTDGVLDYGHPPNAVSANRRPCPAATAGGQAPSLHECFIFPIPAGEGDGLQYNDTSTGFVLDVEAGGQSMLLAEDLEDVEAAGVTDGANGIIPRRPGDGSSAVRLADVMRSQLHYSHIRPSITTVGPAQQTDSVPTAGGVTMLVTGMNFGETPPLRQAQADAISGFIKVEFALPSNDPGAVEAFGRDVEWVECEGADRRTHETIECTLPEGAGSNVAVRVTTAGLMGEADAMVTYDFPVVTGVALHGFSPAFQMALGASEPETSAEEADPTGLLQSSAVWADPDIATQVPNATLREHIGPAVQYASTEGGALGPAGLQIEGAPTRGARPRTMSPDHPAVSYLSVFGANLGRRGAVGNPQLCVFLAHTTRNPTLELNCDGMESFPGEGEVPEAAVIAHTHDRITFELPEGAGQKDIQVSVGGKMLTPATEPEQPRLLYAPPTIRSTRSVVPSNGPTVGGYEVTLHGANFGPKQRNTTARGQALELANGLLVSPVPLSQAASLPTSYLVLEFYMSCITDATSIGGIRPQTGRTSGCQYELVDRDHDFVTFRLPSGIGASRDVAVEVIDAAVAEERVSSGAVGFSGIQRAEARGVFGYDEPTIDRTDPTRVYLESEGELEQYRGALLAVEQRMMASRATGMQLLQESNKPLSEYINSGGMAWGDALVALRDEATTMQQREALQGPTKMVYLFGRNFGNPNLAIRQNWSEAERVVEARIGGVTCLETSRGRQAVTDDPNEDPASTQVECEIEALTVGYKNVTLNIAGQQGQLQARAGVSGVHFVCAPGQFGLEGEHCLPCPEGADCQGYDTDIRKSTPPRPQQGFYNLNSSDSLSGNRTDAECPARRQVPTRDVCVVACEPQWACVGDNFCAVGYASKAPMYRCSSCADGFYRRAGECAKCPDNPWILVIAFAVVAVGACGFGFWLNQSKINIALIAIGVDYFQVLAIFANARVQWPQLLKDMFHILSAFNLNLEITAPECSIPELQYMTKWFFIILLPVAAMIMVVLMYVLGMIYVCAKSGRCKQPKNKKKDELAPLVAGAIVLSLFLYLVTTRSILDVFNCIPTSPPDGQLYMQAVFEPCGKKGGVQLTLLPFAIIALGVYTIGFPAWVGFMLVTSRKTMLLDQLMRSIGKGNDINIDWPKEVQDACQFRQRFQRLYYYFKPEYYWWIVTILARKALIAFCSLFFNTNASFQMAAVNMVLFLCYTAQVRFNPYMPPADYAEVITSWAQSALDSSAKDARTPNRLAVKDIEQAAKTRSGQAGAASSSAAGSVIRDSAGRAVTSRDVHGELWFKIQEVITSLDKRDKRRFGTTMLSASAGGGQAKQTAIGGLGTSIGVLGNSLMNWNTVETLLLFCAIMVTLGGIMLESGRLDQEGAEGQRDALTILLMLVIIVSMVYYFTVLFTEVYVLVTDAQDRKAALIQKAAKKKSKMGGSSAPGAPGVVEEVEIDTSGMQHQSNPAFSSQQGRNSEAGGQALVGQIKEITGLKTMDGETWNRLRPQLEDFAGRFGEMKEQIESLKRDLARSDGSAGGAAAASLSVADRRASIAASLGGARGSSGVMAGNPLHALGGGARRSFAPQGSGGKGGRRASSRLLTSLRKTSKAELGDTIKPQEGDAKVDGDGK